MKKHLKFLLLIPTIVVLFFIGASSNFKVIEDSPLKANDFESFHNQYLDIIQDNRYAKPSEITFDQDVLSVDNGVYMVSGETFEKATGVDVNVDGETVRVSYDKTTIEFESDGRNVRRDANISVASQVATVQNGEVKFSLTDIAEELGYEVRVDIDKVLLNRPYGLKRLIVRSDKNLDNRGAIKVAEGFNDLHIFQYKTEGEMIEALNYYQNCKDVKTVAIDKTVKAQAEAGDITVKGKGDSFSYTTWGAEAMGVEMYSNYLINKVGKANLPEIVVAVLDTGLDSDHSWFVGRVANGGKNFSETVSETEFEYEDGDSHGTHVSGTIVDLTLQNVKILPIKVLSDEGYGSISGIIAGIEYVTELKKNSLNVRAINMSLGAESVVGSESHTIFTEAIEKAYDNGILTVVAAGNESDDAINYSPANVEKAITVGAIAKVDEDKYYKADFSNFGDIVDVVAPGEFIESAYSEDGTTVSYDGTSMASPHVAGAVALLLSDNTKGYTLAEVEELLDETAIDLGEQGKDRYYAEGLVNVSYAYASIMNPVEFSHTETDYDNSFNLSLICAKQGAIIKYTTDGTMPSLTSGSVYSEPISINKTQIVKAVAYVLDKGEVKAYSQPAEQVYCINGKDVENAFSINDSGEITSYRGLMKKVVVPRSINGILATAIGQQVFKQTYIEEISLPDTIESIGYGAFDNSYELRSIYAPGVTIIENRAFLRCYALTNITDEAFPELSTIGEYAFYDCIGIEKIILSKVEIVSSAAFYCWQKGRSSLKSISLPNAVKVRSFAFVDHDTLATISLPKVESIGDYAFRRSDVESVEFPALKSIGKVAFYNAENLNTFNAPNVKLIGAAAFNDCEKLSSVIIDNVEVVGSEAFSGCINLQSLYLPKLRNVDTKAFYSCSLGVIELPSVVYIESSAFEKNENLAKVGLSPCLEYIGKGAFDSCSEELVIDGYAVTVAKRFALENKHIFNDLTRGGTFTYTINDGGVIISGYEGTMPQGLQIPSYIQGRPVVEIADNAFKGSENIYTLRVRCLKRVGASAFKDCSNLESVALDSAIEIGASAFEGCAVLKEVIVDDVQTIEERAFYGCNGLNKISLDDELKSIGTQALGYLSDGSVNPNFVISGNAETIAEEYCNSSGIKFNNLIYDAKRTSWDMRLITVDGVEGIAFAGTSETIVGKFIIPATSWEGLPVVKVDDFAFYHQAEMTEIYLPPSVKIIGKGAFGDCTNLKEINLENIKTIEGDVRYYGAFEGCSSLKKVSIPLVEELPPYVFNECSKLEEIDVSSVKKIGHGAFANCRQLKKIKAPILEEIENSAFLNAERLEKIDAPNLKRIGFLPEEGHSHGEEVFQGCYLLKSLYIPKIEEISANIGSQLEKVLIGNKLRSYDLTESPFANADVYGYNGSLAEEMANEYGLNFYALDEFKITKDLPDTAVVDVADAVELSVESIGWDISYQWYTTSGSIEEGVLLENETHHNLYLENKLSTRKYYVIVTRGDGQSIVSNVCELTITDKATYQITATIVEGKGSITKAGVNIVIEGESKTFKIVPDKGYKIFKIEIDGVIFDEEACYDLYIGRDGYTFSNVTKNHTIKVWFAKERYGLDLIQTEHGLLNSESNTYLYEETAIIKITPDEGYHVKQLIINEEVIDFTGNSYELIITTGFHVRAVFVANTNTPYVVERWQQTLTQEGALIEGKYYELIEKATHTGTTDATTDVQAQPLEGFTALPIVQQVISGDGKTVVKIYYARNRYELTLQAGDGIASVFGGGTHLYGQRVEIEAIEQKRYEFNKWKSGNIELLEDGYSLKHTFTMPASNITFTAQAEEKAYIVKVLRIGNGAEAPVTEQIMVYRGEDLMLEIIAQEGYSLASLLINGEEKSGLLVEGRLVLKEVKEEYVVEATFTIKTYEITIESLGHGTVTPGSAQIEHGSGYATTFIPQEEFEVADVLVDGISIGAVNEYAFDNVKSDHTIKVIFEKKKYVIQATCGQNGMISAVGDTTVLHGDDFTYYVKASTGYKIKDVKVNGESVGAITSYTFENVTANQTIQAEFEIIILTVNVICGTNGRAEASDSIIEYGKKLTISVTPDDGYAIASIKINGKTKNIDKEVVIEKVTEDITVEAEFAPAFSIITTSGANGTITPSEIVISGSRIKIEFYPDEGYKVKDVIVDGMRVGAVEFYLFENINSAHSISVTFEIKTYSVRLLTEGEGTLTCEDALDIVGYGSSREIVVASNEGYRLEAVYVNGERADVTGGKVALSDIKSDLTVKAVFVEQELSFQEKIAGFFNTTTILITAGIALGFIVIVIIIVKRG